MRIKEIDIVGDDLIYKNFTIKINFEMKGACIHKVFSVSNLQNKEIEEKLEGLSQAFYFIDNFNELRK